MRAKFVVWSISAVLTGALVVYVLVRDISVTELTPAVELQQTTGGTVDLPPAEEE